MGKGGAHWSRGRRTGKYTNLQPVLRVGACVLHADVVSWQKT